FFAPRDMKRLQIRARTDEAKNGGAHNDPLLAVEEVTAAQSPLSQRHKDKSVTEMNSPTVIEMNLSYRRFAQNKEGSLGRAARGQSLRKMSDGSGQVRPGAGNRSQDQGRGANQECSRPTLNAASERRESFTRDPRLARGCDVAQSHVGHRGRPDERVSPPTETPVTSSMRPPQSGQDDSALKPTPPPHPQPGAELAPDVTAGKTELPSSSPQSGKKAVPNTLELVTTLVSPSPLSRTDPTISSPPLQEKKAEKGVKNAGILTLEMKTTGEGGGAHIPVRITARSDGAGHRGFGSSWGDLAWELPVMKIKPIESKTSESPGKRRKPTAVSVRPWTASCLVSVIATCPEVQ
ncbi:uncharacterized protein LOC116970334, partial [Amblyraja radiata]|uniref:uncharacterized protein LOC116970334 n=1 Tax=Amblyraja radiata TaxID=386614 RepID=UPI00140233AD